MKFQKETVRGVPHVAAAVDDGKDHLGKLSIFGNLGKLRKLRKHKNKIKTSTSTDHINYNKHISNNNKHNTASFHNFKSQQIKLSVSNPKSKYVA